LKLGAKSPQNHVHVNCSFIDRTKQTIVKVALRIAAGLARTSYTFWTRAGAFSSGTSTVQLGIIIIIAAAIWIITIRVAAIVTVIIEALRAVTITAFIIALQALQL
jgi:hypothetical protein